MDLLVQTLNLILLAFDKLPCMCTILDNITPLIICNEEEKLCEQQISFQGGGDGMGGNGAKVFASLFHCWYYNPVAIFSLWLLAHA